MSPRPRSLPHGSAEPVVRRDADGAVSTAPTWGTLVERLIVEAQEQGAFEDLPGRGQRLIVHDETLTGDMALANHVLRNAGLAPPWIEADKEVRALRAEIERLLESAAGTRPLGHASLERRLGELADRHDEAVARLASLAPSALRHRLPLDRAALRQRLEAALARG